VLLLTDDPSLRAVTERVAESAGVLVREPSPGHVSLPSLVLLGADRFEPEPVEPWLPPEAGGAPRILLSIGDPHESLWRVALQLRAEQVVLLPEAESALYERLCRLVQHPARQALAVAVVGGCGGAGASVLAAALARSATRITRSLLIDLDQLGSGADLLLGAEDEPGLRWPDLASARGRLLPGSLAGIPVIDGIHVLSWDRSPELIGLPVAAGSAVLEAARQEYGVMVLDLPRWLDGVPSSPGAVATAAEAADLGLLVVPAEVRAVAAARRVLAGLNRHLADIRLVIRGPAPTGLRPEAIADALELPLNGFLKPEPGLRVALDRGVPPGLHPRGPLATLCRDLLAQFLLETESERGRA
jgi:secretion/DNA translocation related CpaE-like protein